VFSLSFLGGFQSFDLVWHALNEGFTQSGYLVAVAENHTLIFRSISSLFVVTGLLVGFEQSFWIFQKSSMEFKSREFPCNFTTLSLLSLKHFIEILTKILVVMMKISLQPSYNLKTTYQGVTKVHFGIYG